jgi:hypothetical protein
MDGASDRSGRGTFHAGRKATQQRRARGQDNDAGGYIHFPNAEVSGLLRYVAALQAEPLVAFHAPPLSQPADGAQQGAEVSDCGEADPHIGLIGNVMEMWEFQRRFNVLSRSQRKPKYPLRVAGG